jgi:hypothetical protein
MKPMNNEKLIKKEIFNLIEVITPYNNRYRDLINDRKSGTEVLILMWNVGEKIQSFVDKFQIKPHNLYWRIYGKAEGLKTSYITRDFLSYCLRIRKYFPTIEDIQLKFPHLQKYSLFREAFPVLENSKFKLSQNEEIEIIQILNSRTDPKKIKDIIKNIKSDRIGIKNTRTQKLSEMKHITDNFVIIYNEIYKIIKTNDQVLLTKARENMTKDFLIILSQAVSALTQENLYIPRLENDQEIPNQWELFVKNLRHLLESSIETRNRFRRLVSPRKLFDLADMLGAVATDQGVSNYRKRKGIN